MLFILVLTIFGTDFEEFAYIIESQMTGEDCIVRFEEQQQLLEKTFHKGDFRLSCELDEAEYGDI